VAKAVLVQPSGALGLVILVFHVLMMVVAPIVVPYDYAAQSASDMFLPPSSAHWLGTDNLGRDVLTRVMLGGQAAAVTTVLATTVAVAWGAVAGITAGYRGGLFDELFMRLIDSFQAVPWLLFVMLIAVTLGNAPIVLILVLGFCYGLQSARVARAATLDIVARDYIWAAKARGEPMLTILWQEIMPNIRNVLLVDGAMQWSWMLLWFSSLSFLGLGVSPPHPDWGLMISDARLYLTVIPWAALAPMIALSTFIIGINLTADAFGKALGIDRSAGEAGA
jgi:peptide/nickel transport system permease protein